MRVKGILLLLGCSALSLGAELHSGDRLPLLKGEYLAGGEAILPEAASGRVALLALGFTYDSRFAVEDWVKRFRGAYGSDPRATFYEIPMVGGMAKMGKWFIDSGMRRGTPKADQQHVITVYGGVGPWKSRVAYQDPKAAYLILLDPAGVVRWRYNGKPDDAAFRSLSENVDALLSKVPK